MRIDNLRRQAILDLYLDGSSIAVIVKATKLSKATVEAIINVDAIRCRKEVREYFKELAAAEVE